VGGDTLQPPPPSIQCNRSQTKIAGVGDYECLDLEGQGLDGGGGESINRHGLRGVVIIPCAGLGLREWIEIESEALVPSPSVPIRRWQRGGETPTKPIWKLLRKMRENTGMRKRDSEGNCGL